MDSIRLLALDVDGTLLRSDGTVADVDRDAIAAAAARGIAVTLATGRLSSSAVAVARDFALDVPLVCADGAVLFCPVRGAPVAQTPLGAPGLAAFLGAVRAHDLAPFVFTHEAVCGARGDLERFGFVTGWTSHFVSHDDLDETARGGDGVAPITAIGVGDGQAVSAVLQSLRANPTIADDVVVFPIRTTPHWVVRLTPGGCSKAAGLAVLARRLAIAPSQVAAVGDWHNDVAMLSWAGRSFAMGQAPDEVKRVAGECLAATAETGGGVAEVLERLGRRDVAQGLP